MNVASWTKGAGMVLAAMVAAAQMKAADLTAGGPAMRGAILWIVLAGAGALVMVLMSDSGRAAVAQEDAAAGLVKIPEQVAAMLPPLLLATPAGVAAVGAVQDAVAGEVRP